MDTFIYVIAASLISFIAYQWAFRSIVIYDYERGVKFVRGKVAGVLEPGVHRYYYRWTEVRKINIRERVVNIPGQEILTSDGVSIRVSLVAKYKFSDPALVLTKVENYMQVMYAEIQIGLREFLGTIVVDELLEKREEIGEFVYQRSQQPLAEFGVELISLDVRDIMFPGALKEIFAEELRARKEGLAALERARGETAALRKLANAAKMLEGNPNLFQLRMIQAINESSDNTLILNFSQDSSVLPAGKQKKK